MRSARAELEEREALVGVVRIPLEVHVDRHLDGTGLGLQPGYTGLQPSGTGLQRGWRHLRMLTGVLEDAVDVAITKRARLTEVHGLARCGGHVGSDSELQVHLADGLLEHLRGGGVAKRRLAVDGEDNVANRQPRAGSAQLWVEANHVRTIVTSEADAQLRRRTGLREDDARERRSCSTLAVAATLSLVGPHAGTRGLVREDAMDTATASASEGAIAMFGV